MTQSFSNNVPSPRFSNQSPTTLNDEIRSADELGIRPIKVGAAGFDDIINEGTVKWAVTTNLELLVIPKFLDFNNEIYHTVITRGQPVLAAGEAEIVGTNGLYILLTISNHSGHFRPNSESLYQFFMRLHRIRSPLTPLNKGGTRFFSKSPFLRGI